MKIAKLKTILLTAALSLTMITGCSGAKVITSVMDNTLYQYDADGMLPCYLNNALMGVDTEILESDTLKGYVNEYTLELCDDDVFILFCNMYNQSLEEMDASEARDCLLDYFEDTAVSLDLSKVSGKYFLGEDTSPMSGKTTNFYKIVFSGAKIEVNNASFEGQAALLAYENICVAAIIGTVDNQIPEADISNMIKSATFIESESFSTGDGSKPSYKVPDDLQLNMQDGDTDTNSEEPMDDLTDTDDIDDAEYEDENDSDKPSRPGGSSAGAAASSDILATSITMNGITISYPTSYDDLVDSGFIPGEEADYMVPGNGIEVIMFALEGGAEFNVFFRNTTESELPISECALYGLDIDTYYFSESDRVVIGDSIVMNETTKDELSSMAAIEPYFEYEADDYYSVVYENPEDDSFSNEFGFLDHVLTDFTMYFPYD